MKKVLSMIAALLLCSRNSSANRIIQKCNRQNREASQQAHNGSCVQGFEYHETSPVTEPRS